MAAPECIEVSEELLTEWALSCIHMNHVGTLVQRELPPDGEHSRLVDLAERARRIAWGLHNELLQHGARNTNAHLETHQCIGLREELLSLWAEKCIHIYNFGTLIDRALPRNWAHARTIDLVERITRRACTMYSELLQHGARAPVQPETIPDGITGSPL